MALHYYTEYRLGNRGRICRSYTGFQAFLAIGFDLVFGLLFELVCSGIGLAVWTVTWTVRLTVAFAAPLLARAGCRDDDHRLCRHPALRLDPLGGGPIAIRTR